MKKPHILVLIIVGILVVTGFGISCKKEKEKININGTVYDPNLKTFLANAHITISASMISSGFYNSNYTDIASTTTDANGAFNFEFDKQKSAGYRVFISKDNYFDNTIDINDADVVPGTPYTAAYNLYPVAYIKLHVKNSTPYDTSDAIRYSYTSGYLTCYECCSNILTKGYGKNYDVTTKCKTYGSQNVMINWSVYKAGYDVAYSDTIFCIPFDTTTYQILY
jgi:hypothetical protein